MKKIQSKWIYLGLILAMLFVSTFVTIGNTEGYAPIDPEVPIEPEPPSGGTKYTMKLYGYVKDSSGNAISGARVELKELEWGVSHTVYSSLSGYYSVSVSVYSYIRFTLTVSKDDYNTYSNNYYSPRTYRKDITLSAIDTHFFSCYGFVYDDETGLKLNGVTVTLTSATPGEYSSTVTTGSNGYFSFYLSTSDYEYWTVVASRNGFITKSTQVLPNGYRSADFRLVRDPGDSVKYAVVVGISDYRQMNDLSYCDEDATVWYNHLAGPHMEFYDHIWVYGDEHTSNYPIYSGKATEYNVKQALQNMVNLADSNDIIAIITAGHGGSDGNGKSYLCMWDCFVGESGEDGKLYDTELATILGGAIAGKIFVFLDNCYSGGMGPELMSMSNKEHVYCTTTCTDEGSGIDKGEYQLGLWTYYFLNYSWINNFEISAPPSMEEVFEYAHDNYPYPVGEDRLEDEPQEFDGDSDSPFKPW